MASVWARAPAGQARLREARRHQDDPARAHATTRSFQEMFLDEARIAVAHPAPERRRRSSTSASRTSILYIVMEWVDGDSLAKLYAPSREERRSDPARPARCRIVADACAGLHAAHELHGRRRRRRSASCTATSRRRTSWSRTTGIVKVIDFGIAKAKNRAAGRDRLGRREGQDPLHGAGAAGQGVDRSARRRLGRRACASTSSRLGHLPYRRRERPRRHQRAAMSAEPPPATDDGAAGVRSRRSSSVTRWARSGGALRDRARRCSARLEAAITSSGSAPTTSDVAEFVRINLPDLESKRHESVTKAVAAASAANEAAFAATQVSERAPLVRPAEGAKTVAFKKEQSPAPVVRKKKKKRTTSGGQEESKMTPAAAMFEDAPPEGPTRRRWVWWLIAFAVLGGVGVFGYRERWWVSVTGSPTPVTSTAVPASAPLPAAPATSAAPPPAAATVSVSASSSRFGIGCAACIGIGIGVVSRRAPAWGLLRLSIRFRRARSLAAPASTAEPPARRRASQRPRRQPTIRMGSDPKLPLESAFV